MATATAAGAATTTTRASAGTVAEAAATTTAPGAAPLASSMASSTEVVATGTEDEAGTTSAAPTPATNKRNQEETFVKSKKAPYPSHFHPVSDADVLAWQDRARRFKRRWLWAFAGAPRPGNRTVRAQIIEQCAAGPAPARYLAASRLASGDNSVRPIMRLLESAEFCVQPSGDSSTRKSTFDAILAGCIPVFFHPKSA
ncbi:hypothetical protein ACP70R_019215 [Stipagrostis hirtigluma subsp. patula]